MEQLNLFIQNLRGIGGSKQEEKKSPEIKAVLSQSEDAENNAATRLSDETTSIEHSPTDVSLDIAELQKEATQLFSEGDDILPGFSDESVANSEHDEGLQVNTSFDANQESDSSGASDSLISSENSNLSEISINTEDLDHNKEDYPNTDQADVEEIDTDFNTDNSSAATNTNSFQMGKDNVEQSTLFGMISLPVEIYFKYGNKKEKLEKVDISLEELRKLKSKEFPELEKADKVSWTVEYLVTKDIKDIKQKIEDIKREIESSSDFEKLFAKNKKPLSMEIRPKVSGQTKGGVLYNSYKGSFLNLADAAKSGLIVNYIPGMDGKVYKISNEEFGVISTPAVEIDILDDLKSSFLLKLPKIPYTLLESIISFFKHMCMEYETPFEAMVQVYWDRIEKKYVLVVPKQEVTKYRVNTEDENLDEDRFLLYMDIHSHNTMPAKFSPEDDKDDRAVRLYAVIGRLDKCFPEISVRVSNGGGTDFLNLEPSTVFDYPFCEKNFPIEWFEKIKMVTTTGSEKEEIFDDENVVLNLKIGKTIDIINY